MPLGLRHLAEYVVLDSGQFSLSAFAELEADWYFFECGCHLAGARKDPTRFAA